jgi:hypothetical protein
MFRLSKYSVQIGFIRLHLIYLYTYSSSLLIHSMDFGRVDLTLAHIRSFVLWCFIWFDSDLIGIVHISPHRPITTHGPLKPSFQVFVMLSQPVQYLPSLQPCQSISVIICRYAVDMSWKPEACNELTCFRYLSSEHIM